MAGIGKVMDEVKKAVVGKDAVLLRAVLAILAGGHILLEDVPGVGKTTMALAFSKALGLRYNRMQFTPDVLPSDVTGFSLYNKAVGKMEYQPGAVLDPGDQPHTGRTVGGHGGGASDRGRRNACAAPPFYRYCNTESRRSVGDAAFAGFPDGPVYGEVVPRIPGTAG